MQMMLFKFKISHFGVLDFELIQILGILDLFFSSGIRFYAIFIIMVTSRTLIMSSVTLSSLWFMTN